MDVDVERYLIMDKLGEGAYGIVYKAHDRKENSFVAVKKIRCDFENDGIPPTAIREISLLKRLRNHPNIVQLFTVKYERKSLFLILEYLQFDLHAYLVDSPSVSPPLVKKWTHQILYAIEYCHARGVMHRDLKPSNLLLDVDVNDQHSINIKVGDFGLARSYGVPLRNYTHEVVTLWYRAPEVLLGGSYCISLDMWSIGCVMAEISRGRPLLNGDCEIDQLFKIFRLLGTPTEEIWPGVTSLPDFRPFFPNWPAQKLNESVPSLSGEGLDLLQLLLRYDPPHRISARKALQHAWFRDCDVS